jgi:hypothetical protein
MKLLLATLLESVSEVERVMGVFMVSESRKNIQPQGGSGIYTK